MRLVIQLLLWAVIGVLGYLTFNSVYAPIKFNEVKEERYRKVIDRLKQIRTAQLAHKQVTGEFAPNFDRLIKFLDTAEFTITQRRDTSFLDVDFKKRYGVDKYTQTVIIDTLGHASVKDSLFKNIDYRHFMNVPTTENATFEIAARKIKKNDMAMPVFEVKVAKKVVLSDQDPDLLIQENNVVSVDGVNGEYLKVGSLSEVNTNGNWPKIYESPQK